MKKLPKHFKVQSHDKYLCKKCNGKKHDKDVNLALEKPAKKYIDGLKLETC